MSRHDQPLPRCRECEADLIVCLCGCWRCMACSPVSQDPECEDSWTAHLSTFI